LASFPEIAPEIAFLFEPGKDGLYVRVAGMSDEQRYDEERAKKKHALRRRRPTTKRKSSSAKEPKHTKRFVGPTPEVHPRHD
jgi:hypothetical protein